MLRITKVTDYGFVLLTYIAQDGTEKTYNTRDLARTTSLPLPMVSKILKALARGGILTSHRGARGGYSLERSPETITVTEVISALEGPLALTECLGKEQSKCSVERFCPVKVSWHRINRAIHQALDGIMLAELIQPGLQPVAEPVKAAHQSKSFVIEMGKPSRQEKESKMIESG